MQEYETVTLGAGCFWCVEAVFSQLKGVISVTSGYSGGDVPDPTYRQVCSGNTGHAEVCQIIFDPGQISFADILTVYWSSHDPTSLNRQGSDVGTQYRSVVFYYTEEQKKLAEEFRMKLDESHIYDSPVVTAVERYTVFYPAEIDHQNYFANNKSNPYCASVIQPKVDKVRELFGDKVK